MAKYGTFVYGTAKYGTGEAGEQPVHGGSYLYTLNIKWGSSWVNEAGRLVDAGGHRGRKYYVGKYGETFEYMQPGEFTFLVDNFDQRYNPYNTGGALYGLIEPGKAVEFSVIYVATGAHWHIFTGHIKDIRPTSGRDQVQIIVSDSLQWMADQNITIPQELNIKVHEAINATLNAAGYPFARSIASSNCPITYFDPEKANALDTIRSLSDAGLGTVFVDRHGILKYYDFSTTGQATTAIDQAVLHKEITTNMPWDTVRNKITCIANRYGYTPLEVIWRLDETVTLAAYGSKSYKIEFPNAQVVQPVRGVDYWSSSSLVWSSSGGGLTYVEIYHITVTLTDITSTSATVTIVNSDDAISYLHSIVIKGRKLVNKKVPSYASDAASVAKGPRDFRIDSPWLQDTAFADAYATTLLAHLKTPARDPVITLETRIDGLGIDLLDRITLTSAKLGINNTYDVGGIDYRWLAPTGQAFEQTFYLQTILYSTMAITPNPFNPPGPPIEPPAPPVLGPGLEECLAPATGEASGPYTWPGGVLDVNNMSPYLAVKKWFRPSDHPYRTRIEVDAVWESLIGDTWTPVSSFDFATVAAIDSHSAVVANGSLSGAMVADGIRTYIFDNVDPHYIALLNLALPQSTTLPSPANIFDNVFRGKMTGLSPGTEVLKSGTFTATHVTGIEYIPDQIHIDDLFGEGVLCLQTSGPCSAEYIDGADTIVTAEYGGALYRRNNNVQTGSSVGRKIMTVNGAPSTDTGFYGETGPDAAETIIQVDNIDGYNARLYFEVNPDPYYQGTVPYNHWYISSAPIVSAPLGSGTVYGQTELSEPTYVITRALYGGAGGNVRVTIRSIKLYNVCEGPA